MRPAFHSVIDFGLRDLGVKTEPRRLAVIPAAVVLLLAVVLVWRGRTRVPALVARVRELLAADEKVLGDGLGLVRGAGRGAAAVRLIVATDRRLLLAAPGDPTAVDAP